MGLLGAVIIYLLVWLGILVFYIRTKKSLTDMIGMTVGYAIGTAVFLLIMK